MKAKEFIKLHLDEVVMKPTRLAQMADKIDALIGIEYEMVVPVSGSVFDEPEMQADYDDDPGTYDIRNIVDFFNDGDFNSRNDIRRLEQDLQTDFLEWRDEQFYSRWDADQAEFIYDYVVENLSPEEIADILDLDPEKVDGFTKDQINQAVELIISNSEYSGYVESAQEAARENFDENADESEWLDDRGWNNMSDIENNFSITWPHWTTTNSDSEDDQIKLIADEFSQAIKRPVKVSTRYHGTSREPGKYTIEPDSSIDAVDGESIGLEFISPPLSIKDTITDLEKIKVWAKNTGAYTNKSTGLHMNVSIPNYSILQLDFVKLALLIGDQYVLEQFGRLANTYCQSAVEKIKTNIKSKGLENSERVLQSFKSGLSNLASRVIQDTQVGKYTSINPQSNRVEFRSPGGDYLEEDPKKLINTLRRFIVGLDAAMDPNKFKEDYYKKFYKLIKPSFEQDNELQKVLSLYVSGDKEQALTKAKTLRVQKQAKRGLVPGQKYEWEVMKIADKGRSNYYSVRVIATTEKEAISKGMAAGGIPFNNIDPANLMAIPISKVETDTAPRNKPTTATLNDRPSNPDGHWVIIDPNTDEVVYRFMAANSTDAASVLGQWRAQNVGQNWAIDYDPEGQRGQPRQTPSQRPNRATDVPIRQTEIENMLGLGSQAADANYEIVRRDNYQPVFLFIANTPQDASRVLERYLELIGADADSEDFGFRERALPGSTLDLQRQRVARQAAQTAADQRQWSIVNYRTREEIERYQGTRDEAFDYAIDRYGSNQHIDVVPASDNQTDQSTQERSVQWRILVAGQEVHRFWNRANQGEANTAASQWIRDQIRRGLLRPEEGAEAEVLPVTTNESVTDLKETVTLLKEKWSRKYKRSINCAVPKGFSQRAHCQGRKKHK